MTLRVALLTNMIPPYRLPMLRELGADPDLQLEVWTCSHNEISRKWDTKAGPSDPFSQRTIRGITWSRYDAGRGQYQVLHIRWEIVSLIAECRPSVLILGDASWTRYLAGWIARRYEIPTVFWAEETRWNQSKRKLIRNLYRSALSGSSVVVAPGRVSYEFVSSCGFNEDRIVIAPNSVDVEFFRTHCSALQGSRSMIRKELGCAKDELLILFAARLVGFKRPRLAVETVAETARSERIRCVVAGEGPELEGCKRLAERLGVLDRFVWLGHVNSATMCRLYVAADVLLLCSSYEPWGMVVNESQAFGLPCVVTERVAAGVDLIIPENGRVSQSSPLELAKNIREACRIPRTVAMSAGLKMCEAFSPKRQSAGFREAVEKAVDWKLTL